MLNTFPVPQKGPPTHDPSSYDQDGAKGVEGWLAEPGWSKARTKQHVTLSTSQM